MKTYLITYDLTSPESLPDYSRLAQAIKSHLNWAKLMQSVWLVKTTRSKNEIMDIMKRATDSNDKILIIEVTNDWISYNLPGDVINWMQKGL